MFAGVGGDGFTLCGMSGDGTEILSLGRPLVGGSTA